MARKCPHIANMLASKSCRSNSLRDGSSIEYSASPNFSVSENMVNGNSGSIRIKTDEDLNCEDWMTLRSDYRYRLCGHCGTVYFQGNTGSPCIRCGDGRTKRNLEPTSDSAFDCRIENALEVSEAKCKRLYEERRGTQLKRKVINED